MKTNRNNRVVTEKALQETKVAARKQSRFFGKKSKKNKIVPSPEAGSSTILPLHSRHGTERRIWADFRIIFIAALLMGLPIPPSLWKRKRNRAAENCIEAWKHCTIFLRTLVLALYLRNSSRFWTTLTMQITFDLQNLAGYAPIWIFYVKRREIEHCLKTLHSMSPPLEPRERGRSLSIKLTLLLFVLVMVLFHWTASKFLYVGAFDFIALRLNPGVDPLQGVHYLFTSAVIFSFIFTYHVGTATLYVQALLCSHAYWSCGRLLRWYGRELQREMEVPRLTVDVVSRMLAQFKRVSSCIKEVDQTLGECPLIVYLYVMNDVFTVMGTLLSKDRKHGTIEYDVFLVARALSAAAMFLSLTHNADAVAREKRALQRRMARVSKSIMRPETDLRLATVFYNLYSSIKSTDLYVTCFDFFDIERKIILSGVGIFITYGVWLYQFAASE